MTRRGVRPLPERPPHTVDGFDQAMAHGLLPRPPREPPAVRTGLTAGQAARRFLVKALALVAADLVLIAVIEQGGRPRGAWSFAIGLSGCVVLWLCYRMWGRVGDSSLDELRRGYTTLVMPFGGFWWGEIRRWESVGRRALWDYAGVWVYDITGSQLRRGPDYRREPPGFYPSPNRPGKWELWTGMVWLGNYRDAPSPVTSLR